MYALSQESNIKCTEQIDTNVRHGTELLLQHFMKGYRGQIVLIEHTSLMILNKNVIREGLRKWPLFRHLLHVIQ